MVMVDLKSLDWLYYTHLLLLWSVDHKNCVVTTLDLMFWSATKSLVLTHCDFILVKYTKSLCWRTILTWLVGIAVIGLYCLSCELAFSVWILNLCVEKDFKMVSRCSHRSSYMAEKTSFLDYHFSRHSRFRVNIIIEYWFIFLSTGMCYWREILK